MKTACVWTLQMLAIFFYGLVIVLLGASLSDREGIASFEKSIGRAPLRGRVLGAERPEPHSVSASRSRPLAQTPVFRNSGDFR
jgi:hypothetical protein